MRCKCECDEPVYCKLCGYVMRLKTMFWYGSIMERWKCTNDRCGLIN